jgi:hypothetical protein
MLITFYSVFQIVQGITGVGLVITFVFLIYLYCSPDSRIGKRIKLTTVKLGGPMHFLIRLSLVLFALTTLSDLLSSPLNEKGPFEVYFSFAVVMLLFFGFLFRLPRNEL